VCIILNIETSSKNCSVSVSENGNIIGLKEQSYDEYSHSKSLHVFIDEIFKEIELSPQKLSAVAISEGPGSYTGLRIGVSAAKGICVALNIPLIAIDTMQILARKIECAEGYIISAMDARRDEIYYSVFKSNNCKIPIKVGKTDYMIINSDSFSNYFKSSTVNFVGNCNEKIKGFLDHKNIIFSDFILPSANEMGIISFSRFKKSEFEDISDFQPKYLKEFGGKKINI
jgi:tRNA threonylcarbamoyladenosine biosynthesis protein TsaB